MSVADPRVSAQWLREHLDDMNLVVLDARIHRGVDAQGASLYASGRNDFEQSGHIPGAGFADLFGGFSAADGRFLFTRPTAAQLQAELQRLGVHERSHVVVYDSLNGVWAARVWWLLLAYGQARVSVLDGGLAQWQAAGGGLAFGQAAPVVPGDACSQEIAGRFVDLAEVKAWLRQPGDGQLVCALRGSEYAAGHIPGSLSLPYADWLDEQGRLDVHKVHETTSALNVAPNAELTLYCGGGVNACGLALGLLAAGHAVEHLHVYDGSLNEWRAHPELPLVSGAQP
ncbi:rhodanese-like domain-containing protein [Pseudomonas sp. dw_358]|uniref:sulfurtransferase n=1 Tax=Pseudomonas sp. dw_358 TaxID=2720083 RepID=UPI001BD66DC2|nr:rhodanese-like domain-containing protein [Pseudomonas sp. dw_358]